MFLKLSLLIFMTFRSSFVKRKKNHFIPADLQIWPEVSFKFDIFIFFPNLITSCQSSSKQKITAIAKDLFLKYNYFGLITSKRGPSLPKPIRFPVLSNKEQPAMIKSHKKNLLSGHKGLKKKRKCILRCSFIISGT